jgi:hypothetical protein
LLLFFCKDSKKKDIKKQDFTQNKWLLLEKQGKKQSNLA